MNMKAFRSLLLVIATAKAVTGQNYTSLAKSLSNGVLTITINNTASNLNLIGQRALFEIDQVVTSVRNDPAVKVVIFQSGNPAFFSAHYDFLPRKDDPYSPEVALAESFSANVLWNITQLPQATIAVIDGAARGIGNELILACDMRFASRKAVIGTPEVGIGLASAAGAHLYMAELLGRGRALEYALSGKDIDPFLAERHGWINRAFESSEELYSHVRELAERIALFPHEALTSIKSSISLRKPTKDQIQFNAAEFQKLIALPAAQRLFKEFLVLTKNMTDISIEQDLGATLLKLYNQPK